MHTRKQVHRIAVHLSLKIASNLVQVETQALGNNGMKNCFAIGICMYKSTYVLHAFTCICIKALGMALHYVILLTCIYVEG